VSCWLYQDDQRTCCLDAISLSVGRTFIRESQPLAQDLLNRQCLEPRQVASQCGCSLTITTSLSTSPPPRPPFTFHLHLIPHVPHDRQNHGSQREHRYSAPLFFRSRASEATAPFCLYKQRILPPSYTPHTTHHFSRPSLHFPLGRETHQQWTHCWVSPGCESSDVARRSASHGAWSPCSHKLFH
jgi:hypothetical protein